MQTPQRGGEMAQPVIGEPLKKPMLLGLVFFQTHVEMKLEERSTLSHPSWMP